MFHKEGFKIIAFSFLMSASLVISFEILINSENIKNLVQILTLIQLLLILWFFRNPKRNIVKNSELILSPADGKIVVVDKVNESEFFKDKRIQVSIFLSPLDIHVNRYPVSGEVVYSKHHTGDYLVAWHPKSSIKNERTTVVINNEKFGKILYRQIAGAVARRIVNYAITNSLIEQGEDSGFIKFGSRVDLFLPLESDIKVKVGDRVSGGMSVIV
jgi:phosphatidylserine decarboxylase